MNFEQLNRDAVRKGYLLSAGMWVQGIKGPMSGPKLELRKRSVCWTKRNPFRQSGSHSQTGVKSWSISKSLHRKMLFSRSQSTGSVAF